VSLSAEQCTATPDHLQRKHIGIKSRHEMPNL